MKTSEAFPDINTLKFPALLQVENDNNFREVLLRKRPKSLHKTLGTNLHSDVKNDLKIKVQ